MGKTVLFIDHDDGRSGATTSMEYLVRAFIRAGYSVAVLSPKDAERARPITETGARTLLFGTPRFRSLRLSTHWATYEKLWTPRGMRWLLHNAVKFVLGIVVASRAIKHIRPDLVYVNEHVVVQGSVAARFLRVPSVIHIRSQMTKTGLGAPRYLLSRIILACNAMVFAITKSEAAQLRPKRSEGHRVLVVGEFAPTKTNRSGGKKTKDMFGLSTSKNVVTMLGGFSRIKGTLEFLTAAVQVSAIRDDTVFVLAGPNLSGTLAEEKKYHEECQTVVRVLEQRGLITIVGEIANPLQLIACSDVIVSSNTESHFARPVIEAWACAKPVVASSGKHTEDLVTPGKDGLIFQNRNAYSLTECLIQLLSDRRLRNRLGKAGRMRVESEFNADRNAAFILAQCDQLVGGAICNQ